MNVKLKMSCFVLILAMQFWVADASLAQPDKPLSTESVLKALTPEKIPATRSLVPRKIMSTKDMEFIDYIATRGLKIESISKVDGILKANNLPALDIEIQFGFDSADISQNSLAVLKALGKAITDPALSSSRIMLNGHSDARGGEEYNRQLSQRRAEAVKKFLVSQYDIDPEKLLAFGFGELDLRDRSSPNSSKNRRVEIVNLGR